jgi:hypothetical protein
MRVITAIRTDEHGHIRQLRGDDWPARTARHVLEDLEMGMHSYCVNVDGETLIVYDVPTDNHHRALCAMHPDTDKNVLLELPRF